MTTITTSDGDDGDYDCSCTVALYTEEILLDKRRGQRGDGKNHFKYLNTFTSHFYLSIGTLYELILCTIHFISVFMN